MRATIAPSTAGAASSCYEPAPGLVVRASLLPVERLATLDRAGLDSLALSAIQAASPALGQALDAAGTEEPPPAVAASALRYLIRMSARPTPYGLFAGVGLASWGDRTTACITDGTRSSRARPDMGWLAGWVLALEADPEVRTQAGLVANTGAFEHAGRVHLDPGVSGRGDRPDVSVRATGVVRRALALARRPVDADTLYATLTDSTHGATPERVAALVDELCRLDLLLSELRPPLTGDPVSHVLERLRAIPATRARAGRFAAALSHLSALDRTSPDDAAGYLSALGAARSALRELHRPPNVDTDVLQIDSALPLTGEVNRCVADDATRAVDLLLRLHPAPGGPAYLAAYRSAILARYGPARAIPLLQLLDPRFGLGPPDRGGMPSGTRLGHHHSERDAVLVELAATALHDGAAEVVLGEPELNALATWDPGRSPHDQSSLAPSLELSVLVAAADRAALDRGDYRLVVGPNLGGQAAGRGLARFADLLGEPAVELLRATARAEEGQADGVLTAELVYLPARHRSANVTVRPAVRSYEIPIGVTPGVPADRVVAPDRLAVVVRDDRLRLVWTDQQVEVRVASGHMLNTAGAPSLCQFLAEIGLDGVTSLTDFDWGSARSFPYLPRVRVGRVVLRPAQWQGRRERLRDALDAGDPAAFTSALGRWRERWRIPRHVYLASGDNRLLLDLDDRRQADLLRTELLRPAHGDVVLHEDLPGTGDAWLPGPGGRFVSELVVPMVRRPAPVPPAGHAQGRHTTAPAAIACPVDEADRLRRPGSDWLYVKLCGPAKGRDSLLAGPVRAFVSDLVANGSVDGWFFVRYADPEPHLRLRLHGDADRLRANALPRVATWAADLVAADLLARFAVDTYEREVERYGGPEALALAEAVFAADSAAVCELLGLLAPNDEDQRLDLAVLGGDALLRGLGLDAAGRLAWCTADAPPPKESGAAYRARKDRLRSLLARADGAPAADTGGWPAGAFPVLRQLTAEVTPVAARLEALHADHQSTVPVADAARSLLHLQANRLGLDRVQERLALGLLRRTLASLAAAPLLPR